MDINWYFDVLVQRATDEFEILVGRKVLNKAGKLSDC